MMARRMIAPRSADKGRARASDTARQSGPAAQRNYGAQKAKGGILFFLMPILCFTRKP